MILALAVLVVLGGAAWAGLRARSHLEAGRSALEAGRSALLAGELEAATGSFTDARRSFIEAHGWAENPFALLVGFLPVAGRTPDAIDAISVAAEHVAAAGVDLARGLSRLPDGLGSLAPQGGRIPLETISGLGPSLRAAADQLVTGEDELARAPDSLLLGPVDSALDELEDRLADLRPKVEAAAGLVDELPAFLGAEGTRRYFFCASNPAELRGSGGFIGAFSILTAQDGRISFSPFRSIVNLPNVELGDIPPPNEDYGNRYGGAETFWKNINLTPDFPAAGEAIEHLYEAVEGERLDGTVMADPFALQALMRLTGETRVPGLGTISADSVVEVITNQAYDQLKNDAQRKALIGRVAADVVQRFLTGGGDPREAATALIDAVGGGHLALHSADPDVQRAFVAAGAAGELRRVDGDYLSVVVNNGGGNKVDFYADREVHYDVDLAEDGSAEGQLQVSIQNDAPSGGLSPHVIGPYGKVSEAGENVSLLSMFLAEGAAAERLLEDEELGNWQIVQEGGHPVAELEVRIPSGEGRTIDLSTSLDPGSAMVSSGTYRLTFQGQATIRPTELSLDITTPPGTHIVETSVPMTVDARHATWTGKAPQDRVFEVRFQKGLLARMWDGILEFFNQPVVTF